MYRPQEPPICVNRKGVEFLSKKMARAIEIYYMSVMYHHGKANVVVDALSYMTMGSGLMWKKARKTY